MPIDCRRSRVIRAPKNFSQAAWKLGQKPKERGISARALDDAAAGSPRPRARRGRRTSLPDAHRARHGLQDPRPTRGEAAQGALLSRAARRSLRGRRWRKCFASIARSRSCVQSEAAEPNVAIISYDEKPGIQAIGSTAPDLPPQAGVACGLRARSRIQASWHAEPARRDRPAHRQGSRLCRGSPSLAGVRRFPQADSTPLTPTDTAIKLILDNHSAHISKETKKWLAAQPEGRFTFVFTPKHGSWLNLVEGFFSKMARSDAPPHPRRLQGRTQSEDPRLSR